MKHLKYLIVLLIFFASPTVYGGDKDLGDIKKILKRQVLANAKWALKQQPVTVTSARSERSAGGIHDFFSEGDYWWPNAADTNGAYIQKDGLTNPQNFTAHRKAMVRFSQIIGSLTSAYRITKNEKYVAHAMLHLNAWFVNESTFMNPSLLYAQAIKGKVTGRSIGIIDMIQMMDVAQGVRIIENLPTVNKDEIKKIKNWFASYLTWVTTHPYGLEERDTKNNHASCWVMQVAVFATLTNNRQILEDCKNRFKKILLPNQMDQNGSFPLELKRTKPYGYSLFNVDAMATICHILSNEKDDLWNFKLQDGRSIKNAIDFMYPFVKDKATWPYPTDVMYGNDWPVAQTFLLFAYKKYGNKNWFNTWKKLEHFPQIEEIIRNLPVRNPLIWME